MVVIRGDNGSCQSLTACDNKLNEDMCKAEPWAQMFIAWKTKTTYQAVRRGKCDKVIPTEAKCTICHKFFLLFSVGKSDVFVRVYKETPSPWTCFGGFHNVAIRILHWKHIEIAQSTCSWLICNYRSPFKGIWAKLKGSKHLSFMQFQEYILDINRTKKKQHTSSM